MSHKLPPEQFFDEAQGVVFSDLGVKVKPKNFFRKIFKSKSWKSLPVYLVINDGFIFVYTRNGWGYALDLKEMQSFKMDKKKHPQFHAQITLRFEHGKLELEFDDDKVYKQWWDLLKAIENTEDLQANARKLASDAFWKFLEFVVTAKRIGQRVRVLRYPANTRDLDVTLFNETRLESPPVNDVEDDNEDLSSSRAEEDEEQQQETSLISDFAPTLHSSAYGGPSLLYESFRGSPRVSDSEDFSSPHAEEEEKSDSEQSSGQRKLMDALLATPRRNQKKVEEERPPSLPQILSQVTPPETFEEEEQQRGASLISYSAFTPHSASSARTSPTRETPRANEDGTEALSSTTPQGRRNPPPQRRAPPRKDEPYLDEAGRWRKNGKFCKNPYEN